MEDNTEGLKEYRTWIIYTISLMFIAFVFIAAITIYIDPFFHYHKPLKNIQYLLHNERYQNDGIVRNFEYDSIITGTSMTENFKTSEADNIFNANFVKVAFSGGRYKEINDNLKRAYASGKNIKYIIRCLDYTHLIRDKDSIWEDFNYPVYLYNDNLFDDMNYILNKSVLFETLYTLLYTIKENKTTSFDDYANWNSSYTFGEKAVLSSYVLGEKAKIKRELTDYERTMILENIRQNVTDLADEHKETTFYLFFPPYSICYWDSLNNALEIDWRIAAEEIAVEEILKHSNVKIYSFCNNYELVCNLDNYKDQAHYGEWVNSWILECMHEDKYLLSENNYKDYIKEIREFYNNYDYSLLHK